MTEATITDTLSQPNATTGRGNVERATDNLAATIATTAATWYGEDVSMYDVDSTAAKMLKDAAGEVINAAAVHCAGSEEAARHLADKTIYPDGREALARQAKADAQDKASESIANAQTLIDVGEQILIKDSAPSLGETRSERNANMTLARHDIRMVVESSADSRSLVDKLQDLAKVDSTISTVLTNDDQFTELLLASQGVKPDDRAHYKTLITAAAIQARAGRGNSAAKLATRIGKLRGAVGGAKSMVQPSR